MFFSVTNDEDCNANTFSHDSTVSIISILSNVFFWELMMLIASTFSYISIGKIRTLIEVLGKERCYNMVWS